MPSERRRAPLQKSDEGDRIKESGRRSLAPSLILGWPTFEAAVATFIIAPIRKVSTATSPAERRA